MTLINPPTFIIYDLPLSPAQSAVPRDPREAPVLLRLPEPPVPAHLVGKAIRAAAAERVAAYRQMKDDARLEARDTVRGYCSRYSVEEVQCWLDEARAERGQR